MIRKSLFWGLTLVLVVAIVGLIIRGRKLEKQQADESRGFVQQSKPTATRVLSPRDLGVIESTMEVDSLRSARHRIVIRNHGSTAYNGIQLKVVYLDAGNTVVDARSYAAPGIIPPAGSLRITDMSLAGIPATAVRCRVSIISADIWSDASQSE